MSEQVLKALFVDLDAVRREARNRIKQKLYLFLYGKTERTAEQVMEDLIKAGEICDNFRRQL